MLQAHPGAAYFVLQLGPLAPGPVGGRGGHTERAQPHQRQLRWQTVLMEFGHVRAAAGGDGADVQAEPHGGAHLHVLLPRRHEQLSCGSRGRAGLLSLQAWQVGL